MQNKENIPVNTLPSKKPIEKKEKKSEKNAVHTTPKSKIDQSSAKNRHEKGKGITRTVKVLVDRLAVAKMKMKQSKTDNNLTDEYDTPTKGKILGKDATVRASKSKVKAQKAKKSGKVEKAIDLQTIKQISDQAKDIMRNGSRRKKNVKKPVMRRLQESEKGSMKKAHRKVHNLETSDEGNSSDISDTMLSEHYDVDDDDEDDLHDMSGMEPLSQRSDVIEEEVTNEKGKYTSNANNRYKYIKLCKYLLVFTLHIRSFDKKNW